MYIENFRTISIFVCVQLLAFYLSPLYGMTKVLSKKPSGRSHRTYTAKRASLLKAKTLPTQMQQRSIYTPHKLKGTYAPLTETAQAVSPVHGAAKYTSGALQRMYDIKSNTPSIRLVQELFYKDGPQFRPTQNKSKAGYSLSPSVIGLILGALEVDKLKENDVRENIINQWRNEHKGLTNGAAITRTKVQAVIDLILEVYTEDKNVGRSILLAFLYAKCDPTTTHDIIHYLSSLNTYIPVFKDFSLEEFKKKSVSLEKITPMKKYFAQFDTNTSLSARETEQYTQEEYALVERYLQAMADKTKKMQFSVVGGFEEVVSLIINNEVALSKYPPQVIQGSYGYNNGWRVPDCVETAIRDFFNILLYNHLTQSFDFSLLPDHLVINDKLKTFFENNKTVYSINTPSAGQDFMNLVSNIPNIIYGSGNYELKAADFTSNFINLCNLFFGITAQTIQEVGTLLSDQKRTINIVYNQATNENTKIIFITIHDKKDNTKRYLQLKFNANHAWIEVPGRNVPNAIALLLDSTLLLQKYNLNQNIQTLFNIQSKSMKKLPDIPLQPSVYYAMNPLSDDKVLKMIEHIMHHNVQSKEATDYAYYLYQKLPSEMKIQYLPLLFQSNVREFNDKFKNLSDLFTLENDSDKLELFTKLLPFSKYDNAVLNDALDVLLSVSADDKKKKMIDQLLKLPSWETNEKIRYFFYLYLDYVVSVAYNLNIFTLAFIKKLYSVLPSEKQKLLLAIVLHETVNFYMQGYEEFVVGILDIAKELIALGSQVNITTQENLGTPLFSAIYIGHIDLIKLLLNKGADVNAQGFINGPTPIVFAIRKASLNIMQILTEKGANLNQAVNINLFEFTKGKEGKEQKWPRLETPINLAIIMNKRKELEFLVNGGASINIQSSEGGLTPLLCAIYMDKLDIVKFLVENGADIRASVVLDLSKIQASTSWFSRQKPRVTNPIDFAVMLEKNSIVDFLKEKEKQQQNNTPAESDTAQTGSNNSIWAIIKTIFGSWFSR